jgi:hypothetical protein
MQALMTTRISAAFLAVLLVSGCGGGDGATNNSGDGTPVVGVVSYPQASYLMEIGTSRILRPTITTATGTPISGVEVTYAVSPPGLVTIDATGLTRGVASGTVTVTATAGGRSGSTTLFVHAPVASLQMDSAQLTLDLAESRTLTAVLRDASNAVITAPLPVTWTVASSSIALVSSTGRVTAVARGTTVVTATLGTRSATTQVRVINLADVVRVSFQQPTYGVLVGQSRETVAQGYDEFDIVVPRAPTYSVGFPATVAVTNTGTVTGISVGTASVQASLGTRTGTASVRVFPTTPAGNLGAAITDDQFVLVPAGGAVPSALRVQRTEVTQAQWQATGVALPAGQSRSCALCPVENVTSANVVPFLAALNAAQPGRNYRLPTPTEWEYAARAGSTHPSHYDDLELIAWYVATRDAANSSLVGLRVPNAFGLFDVLGNVAELTTTGVGRGGSWNLPALGIAFTNQNAALLTPIVGVRLIRDP